MKILQTESEKKAFAITSTVFVLLLLLFFFYKITKPTPEPYLLGGEIAINFGNSDKGKGNEQPKDIIEMQPEVTPVEVTEVEVSEPIVVQNTVETPIVKKVDETPVKEVKKEVKPEKVQEPKKEQKPSQTTTDALASLINGPKTSGEKSEGNGTTDQSGAQGRLDGDIYANSFYGSGKGQGSGGGTSWGLNGRSLASKGQVVPDCNEVGTVVVEIRVDKTGNVVAAKYAQGTTNSAKCLTDAAIATAKTFRWKPDDKAPNIQVGFIVINFRVGS
ncbi:energy transducer TonB [Myroides sp. LoEW2-1]|uniref:energy transducer TonB n=1 Tax=Myroides sp. LoEW2-1 TaxID=2683192 RepID=UPI001320E21F|nr:energy transducer TonB [Myroides sp. LoEW2-1]MVX37028.1 energy transducer TonB [Myroides sp. LoEW2-1]